MDKRGKLKAHNHRQQNWKRRHLFAVRVFWIFFISICVLKKSLINFINFKQKSIVIVY